MKEAITKFDLESAFKALDEINVPVVEKGIKANRPALTEIFSRKSKFDSLFEEYYDIGSSEELGNAKEAREAEIAKAKLARIEKIVDLDADSPEDLLTSYVGKYIMQCPQCMTLFYKNKEDVVESEEDPSTVNVNEVCQHCGNESGYALIGKVGEATQEDEDVELDVEFEEEPAEEAAESEADVEDESEESAELDDELADLDLDLDIEDDEAEKAEESFAGCGGSTLMEELQEEADLDVSADEFEKLINSPEFKKPISDTAVRTMLKADTEDENKKKEVTNEGWYEREDAKDRMSDVANAGKFLNRPWTHGAPDVTFINRTTYKVARPDGRASVVVKLDPALSAYGTLNFTVNGIPFKARTDSEAQDLILNELDSVFRKQFDISVDENLSTRAELIEGNLLNTLKDRISSALKKTSSREQKAEWLLANIRKNNSDIDIDDNGEIAADEANQKYTKFVVICCGNKLSDGSYMKKAPAYDDRKLVVNAEDSQEFDNFKKADTYAKTWSDGNGAAYIYLANSINDTEAAVLTYYFNGRISLDLMDLYLKKTAESIAKDASAQETATQEALATFLSNTEKLNETTLENRVSAELREMYYNISNFKLTECLHKDDKLILNGTICFKSGNKRDTSFVFCEALNTADNKLCLIGLNEKLGSDRLFTIKGHTNSKNIFITESFKNTKK